MTNMISCFNYAMFKVKNVVNNIKVRQSKFETNWTSLECSRHVYVPLETNYKYSGAIK